MIKPRPYVIAFEGINGSGKSKQMDIFYRSLLTELIKEPGHTVLSTRLPGTKHPVSSGIRSILDIYGKDMEDASKAFLYLADFIEYSKKIVQDNLFDADVIFCDRSVYSFMAYQLYADELRRNFHLNKDMIKSIFEANVFQGLIPQEVFFIECDLNTALNRIKPSENENNSTVGGFDLKKKAWFKKCLAGYNWAFSLELSAVKKIDGNGSIDEVAERLRPEMLRVAEMIRQHKKDKRRLKG